jgi:hypothetical protein
MGFSDFVHRPDSKKKKKLEDKKTRRFGNYLFPKRRVLIGWDGMDWIDLVSIGTSGGLL